MTRTESDLIELIFTDYGVCPELDEPLTPQLGLDSLELAELVLLIEGRWLFMDDKIAMDRVMMSEATVRSISALIDTEAASL